PAGGRVLEFDWFRLLGAPLNRTFYVSTSGADTNDGLSLSLPLRTLGVAVKKVLPGDTIDLRGGVYNERVDIWSPYSGTATNRVTIQSHPGETAVIDGTGQLLPGSNSPVINMRADYMTFDGLEVRNGAGMGMSGDGDFLILQHLKVHSNQNTG